MDSAVMCCSFLLGELLPTALSCVAQTLTSTHPYLVYVTDIIFDVYVTDRYHRWHPPKRSCIWLMFLYCFPISNKCLTTISHTVSILFPNIKQMFNYYFSYCFPLFHCCFMKCPPKRSYIWRMFLYCFPISNKCLTTISHTVSHYFTAVSWTVSFPPA